MKIGIIGVGYVGNAAKKGFESKGFAVKSYDKYKDSDSFEDVADCEVIFVCVPTPPAETGQIDLSIMDEVMARIADKTTTRKIVVIKSTVIPGTAKKYAKQYSHLRVISNPEFLDAVNAERDFLNPDKIIIRQKTLNNFII